MNTIRITVPAGANEISIPPEFKGKELFVTITNFDVARPPKKVPVEKLFDGIKK